MQGRTLTSFPTLGAQPRKAALHLRCGHAPGVGIVDANMTTEERFWSNVDRSGGPNACWEWQGSLKGPSRNRYGNASLKGRTVRAHRLAWIITHGDIPQGEGAHGTCVCHHCDNPPCCNPAHLFLGTNTDNNHDKERKGRGNHPRGKDNGRAKLSDDDVRSIRLRVARGESRRRVSAEYGVSDVMVSKIFRRSNWAHVTDEFEVRS